MMMMSRNLANPQKATSINQSTVVSCLLSSSMLCRTPFGMEPKRRNPQQFHTWRKAALPTLARCWLAISSICLFSASILFRFSSILSRML